MDVDLYGAVTPFYQPTYRVSHRVDLKINYIDI